jgi:colicin import membrane protein
VGTQNESSVLFSLNELIDLEKDRIEGERMQRERQERAVADAAIAAERQRSEAEEARVRAAEEKQRLELERSRAEAAKLDAIKLAEVQRAKADADHWAKLETARQEHEHVQRLQALRSDKGKKRLLYGVIGCVALLVAGGAGGAILLKQSAEQAETARLSSEANARERDALLAQSRRMQDDAAALTTKYAAAKNEVERLAVAKEQERLKAEQARIAAEIAKQPPQSTGGHPTGDSKPKTKVHCAPGDPICVEN